ncbi:MAG TPA: 3-phosphoshikimate 1-carboxyvinyltransferase, partial [Caldithrix sp.]|nr:3-phosphoshikimate 1-carboxyvinyltransferase [Caldithrix sp.]
MENIKYIPPGRLSGKISLPASKSITHRLLVMAALSGKPCTIRNP